MRQLAMDTRLLLFFWLCQVVCCKWTEWSEWSPCSRSCDGGVQYSSRACVDNKCDGALTRYQLCNTHQPCYPSSSDFRQEQCKSYDNIPYRGQLTNWIPHINNETPCALYCQSKEGYIVRLSEKVHDGTRCREGALDLCIDGQCMRVGCDLVVGSNKTIDGCGVCGGNGTICVTSNGYKWQEKTVGRCSATCGTGFKKVKYVCLDAISEEQVDENHCSVNDKPDLLMVPCNEDPCPVKYRWVVDSWSDCSASCDGGSRRRLVYCGEERNNTHMRAATNKCKGLRPRNQDPCNTHECPKWNEGAWSSCSVSCGEGIRVRTVACRDDHGLPSLLCEKNSMPPSSEICNTGLVCPTLFPEGESSRPPKTRATEGKTPSSNRKKFIDSREKYHFSKSSEEQMFHGSTDELRRFLNSRKQPKKEALVSLRNDDTSFIINNISAEKTYSSEPSFMTGDWGLCSVSCGEGIRKREVLCKIFLEFSRTLAKLPDRECPGKKPHTWEKCFEASCPMTRSYSDSWANDQSRSSKSSSEEIALKNLIPYKKPAFLSENSEEKYAMGVVYVWKISGYSSCSASCLGGVQESIIECVRTSDNQRVSHHFCTLEKRPDSITRTCNDIPCPPRWNISEFSTCNKPCGGGIQTREITCIHEVARGGSNTLPVAAELCPQPAPRSQQFCNMFDCPPAWTTGPWSKCSVPCGGGVKSRAVTCKQIVIPSSLIDTRFAEEESIEQLGQAVDRPSSICPDHIPIDTKSCNKKSCSRVRAKINALSSNFTYLQDPLKKKVTLKIGGRALVYKGTTINIRCPVKHFDKSRITWYKGEDLLRTSGKLQILKKGVLSIMDVSYSDNGIYFCRAGGAEANITLAVQTPPRKFGSSEENGLWTLGPVKGGISIKDYFPSENDARYISNENQESHNIGPYKLKPTGHSYDKEHLNLGQNFGKTSFKVEETNSLESELKLSVGERGSFQGLTSSSDEFSSDHDPDFFDGTPFLTIVTYRPQTTIKRQPPVLPTTPFFTRVRTRTTTSRPVTNWWDVPIQHNDLYSYHGLGSYATSEHHAESSAIRPLPFYATFLMAIKQLFGSIGASVLGIEKGPTRHRLKKWNEPFIKSFDKKIKKQNALTKKILQKELRGKFGKVRFSSLKFEWLLTPWSKCSQTCGGGGFQVRAAQCIVRLYNSTRSVRSSLCELAGLSPLPETLQECGIANCPKWQPGSWTPCEESKCFSLNTALQKRDVLCILDVGKEVDSILCNELEKPAMKRECYNDGCKGAWQADEWSEPLIPTSDDSASS
ncbi:protein madd-4-like isoform X2 [Artemia franciscana]|uniref:protein madd-4-like isoform X2 n=1 Tax=Artemia franciscana TaxID=6661 RepID=UPI0032DA3060